jgi:hypothetical protein
MRHDAIKTQIFTNSYANTHTYTGPMHGRVMIEVKVGKGKHKPHDSEGFGPILHRLRIRFRRFRINNIRRFGSAPMRRLIVLERPAIHRNQ